MALIWQSPIFYKSKLIGSYGENRGDYEIKGSNFEYLALSRGCPYPEEMDKPCVRFFVSSEKLSKYDCLWLLDGTPLISERLADFIRSHAGQEMELITPTTIYTANEEVSCGFYILNVVRKVKVIDRARSDAELDNEGGVIYFNTRFFNSFGMRDINLAREADSHDLLISEKLANEIIEKGFSVDKGLGFYSVDGRLNPYRGQA